MFRYAVYGKRVYMKFHFSIAFTVSFLLLTLALSGCTKKQSQNYQYIRQSSITVGEFTPEKLAPGVLQPGLTVTYYRNFFKRNLTYLKKMKKEDFEVVQGDPIVQLNHQFGEGEVFGSGTNRGIALRMKGYMFFPKPGWYDMQAFSNDGVIVYFEGQRVLSDPKQHSDRLSHIAHFKISAEGWVPITVEFFQRKGTSALKLFWKIPASQEMVVVPKENYGHIPQ